MDSWQQSVPEGMTTKSEHLAVSALSLVCHALLTVMDKTLTPSPWTTPMDYSKMDYPKMDYP